MEHPELAFGATPWDNLDRDAGMSLIDRLYKALMQANDTIDLLDMGSDDDWWRNAKRLGGETRNRVRFVLKTAEPVMRAETPSPSDILKTVARLYDASLSASSTLGITAAGDPTVTKTTAAVRALLHGLLKEARAGYDGDEIFRSFFRWSACVLYPKAELGSYHNWCVCQTCGTVLGRVATGSPAFHDVLHPCDGIFRPYAWSDLNRPDLAD